MGGTAGRRPLPPRPEMPVPAHQVRTKPRHSPSHPLRKGQRRIRPGAGDIQNRNRSQPIPHEESPTTSLNIQTPLQRRRVEPPPKAPHYSPVRYNSRPIRLTVPSAPPPHHQGRSTLTPPTPPGNPEETDPTHSRLTATTYRSEQSKEFANMKQAQIDLPSPPKTTNHLGEKVHLLLLSKTLTTRIVVPVIEALGLKTVIIFVPHKKLQLRVGTILLVTIKTLL